jgi:ketosteroid isomerase-like protein
MHTHFELHDCVSNTVGVAMSIETTLLERVFSLSSSEEERDGERRSFSRFKVRVQETICCRVIKTRLFIRLIRSISQSLLAMALVLLTGCASVPRNSVPSASEQIKQRLAEIFRAAETKDLPRLDSYHWYGPHFTKFASTGQRLDAAAAREGEHKGLSALAGLKLTAENLQIDVFNDAAVATFTMVAAIQSAAQPIIKRERGSLVFVHHAGSWKIVHEHFSAGE